MQVGQIFPKDFFKKYEQMQNKIKTNNQYYLIDFWYSHCGPCVVGFPRLKEIYDQFHGKGFDIVSISVDKQKDKKDYVAAIKKNKLEWNQVWDKDGVTAQKFDINSFPTYILLDKNDRIIKFDIQANQLEAFLKENL
jgi:thiol-disulfide isomerase/thioredoxin